MGGWNLARLCESVLPLVGGDVAPLQGVLDHYAAEVTGQLRAHARRKLGLVRVEPGDDVLCDELPARLSSVETDWTRFHRLLADLSPDSDDDRLVDQLAGAFYEPPRPPAKAAWARWLRSWLDRVAIDHANPEARRAAMNAVNPRYVLRNWLAQQAIDLAAEGDPSGVHTLLDVLRRPYADQPGREAYDQLRPEWARHRAGCSMLSCSS